ncbi:vWA domain-containing protein [Haloglomus halophilum]|uniref:vWA domain-containing protein n=1 Tax=Haloglomus halophilum TaxID=2962672 RepID=UPI0020C96FC0|nr:vWA domain-containing protein [Haloglomus halophilum]
MSPDTTTHITFVLDSSGSMSKIREDTIGGFNTFLADQREEPGRASVTLYEFSDSVSQVYQGTPLADAPELDTETYTPGGQTALHDAIATAVTETDGHIEKQPATVQPDTVIVVVLTDGKENASETPQDRVRELIEQYREEHDWEFLFIGANQDAVLTATEMGIEADKSLDMAHSGEGTQAAYESTSRNVREARQTGEAGGFTDADRQRQDEVDDR